MPTAMPDISQTNLISTATRATTDSLSSRDDQTYEILDNLYDRDESESVVNRQGESAASHDILTFLPDKAEDTPITEQNLGADQDSAQRPEPSSVAIPLTNLSFVKNEVKIDILPYCPPLWTTDSGTSDSHGALGDGRQNTKELDVSSNLTSSEPGTTWMRRCLRHVILGELIFQNRPVNLMMGVGQNRNIFSLPDPPSFITTGCALVATRDAICVTGGWKFERATFWFRKTLDQPWIRERDLVHGRLRHGMAVSGRRIYVAGGAPDFLLKGRVTEVEMKDTGLGESAWRVVGELSRGVMDAGVAFSGPRLLVVGGLGEQGQSDLIQVFDVTTRTACKLISCLLPIDMSYVRYVGDFNGPRFLTKDGILFALRVSFYKYSCSASINSCASKLSFLTSENSGPEKRRSSAERSTLEEIEESKNGFGRVDIEKATREKTGECNCVDVANHIDERQQWNEEDAERTSVSEVQECCVDIGTTAELGISDEESLDVLHQIDKAKACSHQATGKSDKKILQMKTTPEIDYKKSNICRNEMENKEKPLKDADNTNIVTTLMTGGLGSDDFDTHASDGRWQKEPQTELAENKQEFEYESIFSESVEFEEVQKHTCIVNSPVAEGTNSKDDIANVPCTDLGVSGRPEKKFPANIEDTVMEYSPVSEGEAPEERQTIQMESTHETNTRDFEISKRRKSSAFEQFNHVVENNAKQSGGFAVFPCTGVEFAVLSDSRDENQANTAAKTMVSEFDTLVKDKLEDKKQKTFKAEQGNHAKKTDEMITVDVVEVSVLDDFVERLHFGAFVDDDHFHVFGGRDTFYPCNPSLEVAAMDTFCPSGIKHCESYFPHLPFPLAVWGVVPF